MELWKNPSIVKHHVDIRVAPRSVTSLLQTLNDAGIPHHVIADDLHKFVYFRYAQIGIMLWHSISRLTVTILRTCRLPNAHSYEELDASYSANDIVT